MFQSLSLFCIVLLLITVQSSNANLKSNLKSELGITSKSLEGSMLTQNQLQNCGMSYLQEIEDKLAKPN
jgi:hypothetical protein